MGLWQFKIWMKDLNVRQEAIKLLKEKAGKNLFDLARSNFLLNMSQRQGKQRINTQDRQTSEENLQAEHS